MGEVAGLACAAAKTRSACLAYVVATAATLATDSSRVSQMASEGGLFGAAQAWSAIPPSFCRLRELMEGSFLSDRSHAGAVDFCVHSRWLYSGHGFSGRGLFQ
jgi:hypothetical protein